MKYELGKDYRIKFLDHCQLEGKSPEEAKSYKVYLTSWGKCVAITPDYVIIAYNWESNTSTNNDNMLIAKKLITEVKEI